MFIFLIIEMDLIKWDNDFSVHIKEIDEQHKKLINLINDTYEHMKNDKGQEIMPKIFEQLNTYTNEHFNTEEKYFKMFNYFDKENHIKEHQAFKRKIEEFKSSSNKTSDLTYEILMFLSDWLHKHLIEIDQKYVECFKKHGLE